MKRAKKQLGHCEDTSCRFNGVTHKSNDRVCCYGLRNNYGCPMEDEAVEDRANELLLDTMSSVFLGKRIHIKEDRLVAEHIVTEQKIFEFIFKGHHYRASDSARNQGECPHCGKKAKRMLWSTKSNSFIGTYKKIINCFECPSCFKKFYYHTKGR